MINGMINKTFEKYHIAHPAQTQLLPVQLSSNLNASFNDIDINNTRKY